MKPAPDQAGPDEIRRFFVRAARKAPTSVSVGGLRFTGDWLQGSVDPGLLAEAVRKAEAGPVVLLKASRINRTFRAEVLGQDAVVKRFGFARPLQRIAYAPRLSRGRRDWAAACTFAHFGLPAPQPLGFLECSRGGLPVASYALARYLPDSSNARAWVRPHLHRFDPDFRAAVRAEILALLLDLYRRHVYHADTKAGNLLLAHPEEPGNRAWRWIDLDCVRFGRPPTPRRVFRNLVQLNGSIGSKLPEQDRLDFLHALYAALDWSVPPDLPERLRRETRRRLQRELDRTCGP